MVSLHKLTWIRNLPVRIQRYPNQQMFTIAVKLQFKVTWGVLWKKETTKQCRWHEGCDWTVWGRGMDERVLHHRRRNSKLFPKCKEARHGCHLSLERIFLWVWELSLEERLDVTPLNQPNGKKPVKLCAKCSRWWSSVYKFIYLATRESTVAPANFPSFHTRVQSEETIWRLEIIVRSIFIKKWVRNTSK